MNHGLYYDSITHRVALMLHQAPRVWFTTGSLAEAARVPVCETMFAQVEYADMPDHWRLATQYLRRLERGGYAIRKRQGARWLYRAGPRTPATWVIQRTHKNTMELSRGGNT
jgi:hypothetical protein